jgi:hypothetical protein
MRTLTPAAAALQARAVAGERIPVVQLIEVGLSPRLYLSTAGVPLSWAGQTWAPTALTVEPISHAQGELASLQFTLPAVSPDDLAMVLAEDVEGADVRVYDAWVDPETAQVADAPLSWAGRLNVPGFADGAGAGTAAAQWTADHRAVQAYRAKPVRYTNAEQQRLAPGDTSRNVAAETDAAPIAWPSASYFHK